MSAFKQLQATLSGTSVLDPYGNLLLERTFLCSVSSEPTAISRTEQSQWLQKSGMLDVPKLLDIAALYGDCNPELLRQLMVQVKL